MSASAQVAGASQALSQGSTEQAASLEETSASMEEMASMTRKNAENAGPASTEVAHTARLTDSANAALPVSAEHAIPFGDSGTYGSF